MTELCGFCSQPSAVWNRHKTLSLAERATGEEGTVSKARSRKNHLSDTQVALTSGGGRLYVSL